MHFASCRRTRSALDELRSLLEQGHIKPVIDSAMPLAEVAEAHKKLEAGGLRGKIVLSV
jgi:NADPH2:quinone reductase